MEKLDLTLSGVVIVNKGEGLSSQAVVNRVKRIFGISKAGHTGTLDPLATGVLPVLVGRAVKASEFMLTSDKHYRATLMLGITTDTEDITGEVLTRSEIVPSDDEVVAAAKSFIGDSMQVPPMYSAIKVGGAKLYELARRGEVIEREARKITVHSLTCTPIGNREYILDVHCSKGTYIRTLLADIGAKLGTGGVMKTLCRTEASGYTLDCAHTLEELEAMSDAEKIALVRPTSEIFAKHPSVMLSDFFSRLAHAGQEIYLKKIGASFDIGTMVRLEDASGFFAIGEVREFENGLAIKPIRQFGKL